MKQKIKRKKTLTYNLIDNNKLINNDKLVNNNYIITKIIFLFFLISLINILFFSSIFFYTYNLNYYDKEYNKYNIYNLFSKELALNKTINIMNFFKNKELLDDKFFNENEISHLNDVRIIFNKINFIYNFSLIVFFIILFYILKIKDYMKLFNSFIVAGLIGVSLIFLLVLFYSLFSFDFLFEYFHILFFKDNYAFDPKVSNMKALFPNEFFFDIAESIILLTFIKFFILLLFGFFLKFKFKNSL